MNPWLVLVLVNVAWIIGFVTAWWVRGRIDRYLWGTTQAVRQFGDHLNEQMRILQGRKPTAD